MRYRIFMIIMGVKISELNRKKVLEKIQDFLLSNKQYFIATPNPEIILGAMKDEELFIILDRADLQIPDGIGLKFAAWTMFKNLKIYSGADLVQDLLKIAEEKKYKVVIVNWKDGLSGREEIESALKKRNPGLEFLVIDSSRDFKDAGNFEKLKTYAPQIIFCAFGSPQQEKFIFHYLKKLPSARIGIGVGTSLDYVSGAIKRAPLLIRKFGFEWLWRLLKILLVKNKDVKIYKTKRIKRIFNAVIVFPLQFLKWRFVLPFIYRPNVACFLYKKEGSSYKILLVERAEEPGYWQIPQGGLDGANIENAGAKELREEINTDKFRLVKVFAKIYKYKFGSDISGKYSKLGKKAPKHHGYRGQKQSLFIAEFLGKDEDIKVNYWDHSAWKWVKIEDFIESVHPSRKKAGRIFLEKFKETIDS